MNFVTNDALDQWLGVVVDERLKNDVSLLVARCQQQRVEKTVDPDRRIVHIQLVLTDGQLRPLQGWSRAGLRWLRAAAAVI